MTFNPYFQYIRFNGVLKDDTSKPLVEPHIQRPSKRFDTLRKGLWGSVVTEGGDPGGMESFRVTYRIKDPVEENPFILLI